MYLEHVHIRHMRHVRDLRLSFTNEDGSPRMFTVLIGKNGTGKTTILQAIAMAVAGGLRANQLVNAASVRDAGSEHYNPAIYRKLAVADGLRFLGSRLLGLLYNQDLWLDFGIDDSFEIMYDNGINNMLNGMRYESGPVADVKRSHDAAFIVGYGIHRTTPPELYSDYPEDAARDRLESLFSTHKQILGINFIDFFRRTRKDYAGEYERSLMEVFARTSRLLPGVARFEAQGSEPEDERLPERLAVAHRFVMAPNDGPEVRLPAGWLSQGYQGLVAWIADLIGYACLEQKQAVPPAEIVGIALIDEIDLYLHPSWQVQLIPILREIFPKVQFIVTTHSPLVISSLKSDEVVVLDFDEAGSVVARPQEVDPRLKTGSELLQSFFGVQDTYPAELGRALRKYLYLANDPYRTDAEDAELDGLRATLRAHSFEPGFEAVPREAIPPAPAPEGEEDEA
jgi:predicted ATPase